MLEEETVETGPRMVLDPLALRLFKYHRELADESLVKRLLPVPVVPTLNRRKRIARMLGHDKLMAPAQVVKQIIADVVEKVTPPEPLPKYPTLKQIMEEVCEKHGVDAHTLRCKMRLAWVVDIRNEFFYRASKETIHSYPSLGRFCGGRDHTTVMYAVASYCNKHDLPHPRGSACIDIVTKRAKLKKWTEQRAALRREGALL